MATSVFVETQATIHLSTKDDALTVNLNLPDSDASYLHLDHPTPDECVKIWSGTAAAWKDSLTVPLYIKESQFLTTIPLAKDGGMTIWVLVDKRLPPNQRELLCSCESFRKRSLTSDADGNVTDNIIHGIASVFCPPQYRRRGFAARHMKEISRVLRTWQSDHGKSVGCVLYSDIGKSYYTNLGWIPNATNSHLVFAPVAMESWPSDVRPVLESDLEDLCRRDETLIRAAMARPEKAIKRRVTVLPDLDHMLWHIRKEDFATQYIFGKIPQAKGAIAGPPGRQVWAVWTHRYYGHPDQQEENSDNVLYILRLVVEGDHTANRPLSLAASEDKNGAQVSIYNAYAEQAAALKAVLQAAQAEAAEWRLDHVKLWEPSPLVRTLIAQQIPEHEEVEREEESIASGMWWFDEQDIVIEGLSSTKEQCDDEDERPTWINNEHYAWC